MHRRCLLIKSYINILGPLWAHTVPRAHQPLETNNYINSNNSKFAHHCPHLQALPSPPPGVPKMPWMRLTTEKSAPAPHPERRYCPAAGTFCRLPFPNPIPVPMLSPGSQICKTHQPPRGTSPAVLTSQSHTGSPTKSREGLPLHNHVLLCFLGLKTA